MTNKVIAFLMTFFSLIFISADEIYLDENHDFTQEFEELATSLSVTENEIIYMHIIESITEDGSILILDDGLAFSVNWWYRSNTKRWNVGDQIYITYDHASERCKLEHAVLKDVAWSTVRNREITFRINSFMGLLGILFSSSDLEPYEFPLISSITHPPKNSVSSPTLTLNNGYVFDILTKQTAHQKKWQDNNGVVVFANLDGTYQLWNIDLNIVFEGKLVEKLNDDFNDKNGVELQFKDILGLEERLNQKVIQQPEATKAVATSLLIYSAGLQNKERPVGVFLFLGPTGVGKTELAKALTSDIYKDVSNLLRFDMSHFVEPHSTARLIGSPPGYQNHEEGGQLTEPLNNNSQVVVLLDEMEKAHPQVHKMFLPVFDEGFILDNKNNAVDCTNTIFIMTSNLCGPEIAELYRLGYTAEEILPIIEPVLIEALSPELYNRLEPVLFQPLRKESMQALVEVILNRLISKAWREKQIRLTIDDSLKEFLIEKGYHSLLGARPLNKLVEKRVVAALAYAMIKDRIEADSGVTLIYNWENDTVDVYLEFF